MDRPTGRPYSTNPNQISVLHSADVEMRAIWYPIFTVRSERDVRTAMKMATEMRRPFTVVYNTPIEP